MVLVFGSASDSPHAIHIHYFTYPHSLHTSSQSHSTPHRLTITPGSPPQKVYIHSSRHHSFRHHSFRLTFTPPIHFTTRSQFTPPICLLDRFTSLRRLTTTPHLILPHLSNPATPTAYPLITPTTIHLTCPPLHGLSHDQLTTLPMDGSPESRTITSTPPSPSLTAHSQIFSTVLGSRVEVRLMYS